MRPILILAVVVAAAGCGEPQTATPQKAPVVIAANQESAVPPGPPDLDHTSTLGMMHAAHSKALQIGMSADDALLIYTGPPGSYSRSDLPPSIPSNIFEAQGWQTKDEGFGMILYKGRVALALYQLDRTSQDRLNEIVRLEEEAYGPPNVMPGKDVSYWFWKSPEKNADQLMMVCATQVQPGKFDVALALGTGPLMTTLLMTPDAAERDKATAERLIEKRRTHSKGNPANSANPTGG